MAVLPSLESLRCFAAAARQPTFRAAARQVALSPAAFGERIKRLEEELGCALFARTTRRVALTPEGERLLAHAEQCLREAERCAEVARSDAVRQPFSLTIGTRFSFGMSWLTPALRGLEQAAPERQLHLLFGDTPALLDALRRGQADGIVTSARLTSAGLRYARLHEEQYAFVGAPTILRERPIVRCDDVRRHRLLDIDDGLPLFRYFLDARPGSEVWGFREVQHLGSIGPIRARAVAGEGVAVLPRYFVAPDLRHKRLRPILPRVKMPSDWFRLAWRAEHPREERLRELAGELGALPLR